MIKPIRSVGILVSVALVGATSLAAVANAATSTIASDTFSRSVSSGWGSADSGGSWGSRGTLSVRDGRGRMVLSPGSGSHAALSTLWSNADVTVELGADKAATGGGQYYSVVGRGNASNGYLTAAKVRPDGSADVSLRRTVNKAETVLKSTTVTGLNVTAGTRLLVRMSVTGTAPTELRAKIWRVGQAEPSAWQVTTSDTNTSVPSTGSLMLAGYLSGSTSNGSTELSFDNVRVVTTTESTTSTPGAKPSAATTGVPDGMSLKTLTRSNIPYAADTMYSDGSVLVINTPNAVYDGYRFDTFVEVRAPGVKITRSLFRGFSSGGRPLLHVLPQRYTAGQPSAVVEDSTLIPQAPNNSINGVMGSNVTLRRVEITRTVDGVFIYGTTSRTDPNAGNVTIEASWIHDLTYYKDGSHSDGTHNDGVQVTGGKNIKIIGSRIDGSIYNAGVMVTAGRNNVSDVTISGNWLAGGGCTVNVYDGDISTAIQGIRLTNNVFTRGSTRHADCAMVISNRTRAVTTATGNTWQDNSSPAPTVRSGG